MVAAMRVTRPSSAREAVDVTDLLAVSSGLLRMGVPVLRVGGRSAPGTALSMSAERGEVNSFERQWW